MRTDWEPETGVCRVCETYVPRTALVEGTVDENGVGVCQECEAEAARHL